MALHIQDKETDRLVREFARRRGVRLTDAVKMAVTEATKNDDIDTRDLRQRIEPILHRVRSAMKENRTSVEDVKRFMDEGWGGL